MLSSSILHYLMGSASLGMAMSLEKAFSGLSFSSLSDLMEETVLILFSIIKFIWFVLFY